MLKKTDYLTPGWEDYYKDLNLNNLWCDSNRILLSKSVNPSFYFSQLELIRHFIKDKSVKSIVEVGGNFGGLAKELCQDVDAYCFVEIEPMLSFAKKYLNGDVDFVDAKDIESIGKFDLFISNQCLSEVPDTFKKCIYNMLPKMKHIFIIDNEIDEKKVSQTHDIHKEPYTDFHYPLTLYFCTRRED